MSFCNSPLYNALFFYIVIVVLIVILKPEFMYCQKTKKFKSFGSQQNQTFICFPLVCLTCAVVLYFVFLVVEILNRYLDSVGTK